MDREDLRRHHVQQAERAKKRESLRSWHVFLLNKIKEQWAILEKEPNGVLLMSTLQVAVPMRIMELRETRRLIGEEAFWRHATERSHYCGQYIAEHGDALMFKTVASQKAIEEARKAGTEPKSSATAFNRLAEGLSLLAFVPGGVTAFGSHWEVR